MGRGRRGGTCSFRKVGENWGTVSRLERSRDKLPYSEDATLP